jgi:hypothetical protein
MTNLAAGTHTEGFDVQYALITVGDGDLSLVQRMWVKVTSLTAVYSSTYANITLDDTSPNVSYSGAFVHCNNGFNPQYYNNTFQLVYCSLHFLVVLTRVKVAPQPRMQARQFPFMVCPLTFHSTVETLMTLFSSYRQCHQCLRWRGSDSWQVIVEWVPIGSCSDCWNSFRFIRCQYRWHPGWDLQRLCNCLSASAASGGCCVVQGNTSHYPL